MRIFFLLICISVLLTGCALSIEIKTPTTAATPTPTLTDTSKPTPAPTEATDSPTPTPTATATATVEPTASTTTPAFFNSAKEVWEQVYVPCPEDLKQIACLDLAITEIHSCPGEPIGNCWAIAREKDTRGQITPFMGRNPMNCGNHQDGWMHKRDDRDRFGRKSPPWDPILAGSGVPDNFVGLLDGLTLRPCHLLPAP